MNAYSVTKNNYIENEKESRIFTPEPVCQWLKDLVSPHIKPGSVIFDPAVGCGNLLQPFSDDYVLIGNDIEEADIEYLDYFHKSDFLDWNINDKPEVDLVTCNSPYNHSKESRAKHGRNNLLPSLFAMKVFSIYGKDMPLILFTPMGMRLNQRCYTPGQGSRYKDIRDNMGSITSIISLPLDLFHNPNFNTEKPEQRRNPKKHILKSNIKRIETHQEILIFNIPELDSHYCLPEGVISEVRKGDVKSKYEK